jgi:uncharacterized protein YndB with AHSA1/START domain
MSSNAIRWPVRFHPDTAPIHVRNELEMAARPEKIWAALVRAPQWPDWYPNASGVKLLDGAETLSLGGRFRWTTFGTTIVSEVAEFEPHERIAWTGKTFGVDVYHAWLIRPSAHGASVLTEETQYGFLARLAAGVMPGRMHRFHQIWLERLEVRAQMF